MDFWATKTRSEREQEEDERLVRPNPDVKPPRRDLRRERVNPDSDPDADDASDKKDRSRNYKHMAAVQLIERAKQARRRPGDRIPAKNRETGTTVMISPSTLKEQPGKYTVLKEEKAEPEDSGKKKPEEDDPSSFRYPGPGEFTPAKPKPKKDEDFRYGPPEDHSPKPEPEEEPEEEEAEEPEAPEEEKAPETEEDSDAEEDSEEDDTEDAEDEEADPEEPEPKPEVEEAPKAPVEAPKEKPAEPKEEVAPAPEKPAEAPKADAPIAPEPNPVTPPEEPSKEEAPKAEAPKEKKPKKPKAPKKPEGEKPEGDEAKPEPSVAEKAGIAPPKRRPVNSAEREEALSLLVDTFPPEVSSELIAKNLHPDDVKALIRTYTAASKVDPKSMGDVVAKASTFFQMDPDKVPPPASGKNAAGEMVSFDTLTPEEQSETTRKHQLQIAAMSLAAKSMLTKQFEGKGGLTGKPRIPKNLASTLAHLVLSNAPEDKAGEIATKVFDTVVEGGEIANISDKSARALLDQVKGHPAARAAATAYLQANDYGLAKDKFLKGDDETLSEWQDPKTILKGLQKAGQFFEARNALYGTDGSTHPASTFFRSRVMSRLHSLDPKKARMVGAALPMLEAKEYKERHHTWEAKYQEWAAKDVAHDKAVHDYMDNPGKKKPPGAFNEPEPVEPIAPAAQVKPDAESPWESFSPSKPAKPGEKPEGQASAKEAPLDDKERTEVAQSVEKMVQNPPKLDEEEPEEDESEDEDLDDEERASIEQAAEEMIKNPPKLSSKQASDFTYLAAPVMGSASKSAVYHGIDPYSYGPAAYPGWLQPHQRDIGDADFKVILGLAEDWLKSPMLSVAVDGMVPDARYRAALDLAIYDSPYNRAINSGQYNLLLAKLAGVKAPGLGETLMTVTASHNFKTETRYILAHGLAPITGQVLSAVEGEEFPFTDEDGKSRKGGRVAVRVTRTMSAADAAPAGQVAETVLRIDFPQGSEQAALHGVQAALAKFKLAAEKTTPGHLPQFRASTFSPTPSVPTEGSIPMKASTQIRKFAAEVAKTNSKLAFEMLASADRLAEEEKSMPPWLEKKIDDKDDKKEDKGQQSKEAGVKLGSLRTLIIKQASGVEASQRGPWLPVLQALKDLG